MVNLAIANRVVMYYQTQYQNGKYVSVLPLIGYVTHLFLAAFHLNMGHTGPDIVHLNDNQPPCFSSTISFSHRRFVQHICL